MPAPANDNFASAQALSTTLPGSLTGLTTFDATEEAGEPELGPGGTTIEQSIWFTFTPTSTGWYRFRIPFSSLVYNGTATASSGEIRIAIFAQSTLANCTTANALQQDSGFTDPAWQDKHNPSVSAQLTSGTTYYIKVFSAFGTTLNRSTCDFSLEWETVGPVAGNDNFANRTTISGSSGSQAFNTELTTAETNEPVPYYWSTVVSSYPGVWFEWTAPSTGWFEFKVEDTEWSRAYLDLAIYTGAALNALTPVVKNEGGGPGNTSNPGASTTKIGFQATNGTVYKIQVSQFGTYATQYGGAGTLTWTALATPTGDTTSAAVVGPIPANTRVDNYGNSDDELPPSAVTRLSPHPDWWYTNGAVGRSKWWKYVAAGSGTLRVEAKTYATTEKGYSEYAILAYKGANYANLTSVNDTQGDDAVMIGASNNPARTIGLGALPQREYLDVAFSSGETVWVCLVGLYDNDTATYPSVTAADCPQTSLDLTLTPGAPANDNRAALNNSPLATVYPWYLSRSIYGASWTEREAGQVVGTTIGATAEGGEAANAGYGPTRTVWYLLDIADTGDYKLWVESSVDCVLGLYNYNAGALGSLIAADDDSGPGNQPEITQLLFIGRYWIVVDSKTEGNFTLKWEKVATGSPPGNDDFANATVVSSLPYSANGTTVAATAEPEEIEAEELGLGPKDTVWYKYVAPANGIAKIKATCNTNNNDAYVYIDTWRGTTIDNLVRHPNPPPTGPGGGIFRGFFNYFDTPDEIEAASVHIDLDAGQTYYIRVQTESGGSEDFTIYVDEAPIYINIQVSGDEEMHGTLIDDATVPVDIQISSVEEFRPATTLDSAEVYVNLQASGTDLAAKEYLDAATVYLDITIDSHDCLTVWSSSELYARAWDRFETAVNGRWLGTIAYRRWDVIAGDGLEEC